MATNQGFKSFVPKGELVHPEFLFHWLRSNRAYLESLGNGATFKEVSKGVISRVEINLPPLEEQRRIAAILDQAETLRTQRRTALALLDNLTQSLFLDMFGDGLTNPHDWPTQSIDSVCELVVDCVNRTAPVVEEPTPYKMIRTTNVKGGNVDLSSVRHVSAEIFKDWNRRATPRRGDVLLTREAPVGEAGILATNDNVFLGQRLMLYRPALNRLTSEYLLYSFMSPYLQLQFNRHGSGSTVKHLPLPACRAFELRIPPFPLQQTFATRIASIEALKVTHRRALAALDALFASLQQRAFSGALARGAAQTTDELPQCDAAIGLEALIYVAKRIPNGDHYKSLKAIYFADTHHLKQHGRLIYNETYCALPHGPVPQAAYDATRVLSGERLLSDFDDEALRAALRRQGNTLTALREADFSQLNAAIVESLDWAVRYCRDMTFEQTKTASHDGAYAGTPKNEMIPLRALIDMVRG